MTLNNFILVAPLYTSKGCLNYDIVYFTQVDTKGRYEIVADALWFEVTKRSRECVSSHLNLSVNTPPQKKGVFCHYESTFHF